MGSMKHADKIPKTKESLNKRGLRPGSAFNIEFDDKSKIDESEASWKDFSDIQTVQRGEGKKEVYLCKYPCKKIKVTHEGMSTEITVKKGEDVFQSIVSIVTFMPNGQSKKETLGRLVGTVKDGKIIEERFLDEKLGKVTGFKF